MIISGSKMFGQLAQKSMDIYNYLDINDKKWTYNVGCISNKVGESMFENEKRISYIYLCTKGNFPNNRDRSESNKSK
jgi:hypothetical protein